MDAHSSPAASRPLTGTAHPRQRRDRLGPATPDEPTAHNVVPSDTANSRRMARWWRIRLFRGMVRDVLRRAPYYRSDWVDAWDYRVVPATVYMYFAKWVCQGVKMGIGVGADSRCSILPALAFSLDMYVISRLVYDKR